MHRPNGFAGWAAGTAAIFLAIAALMCVAIIPAEIFFDPDADIAGALMTSLMVALLNVVLAFVVTTAPRSRAGLIVVAAIAAGLSLFLLDGAFALAAGHPRASAFVPMPFWGGFAADAIAAVVTVVAAIGMPRTGTPNRALPH